MASKSALIEEISNMLMECDLFNQFSGASLKSIARYFSASRIEKGKAIFKEGDVGNFMCIICSGKVAVYKTNSDGENIKIATLRSGRAFGEMAVLDSERRSATCASATQCTLLVLSKESLDKMVLQIPATAAKVIRTVAASLSRRLRVADGQIIEHCI